MEEVLFAYKEFHKEDLVVMMDPIQQRRLNGEQSLIRQKQVTKD